MTKKPRCPNGSRRKPRKTGKCVKNKKQTKKKISTSQKSFLKGIKSKTKTLTLPSSKSKSKSKSNSKTKKKGNYRSFMKCEMKKLKKENPNMRQPSIMKMAAKNWKTQ